MIDFSDLAASRSLAVAETVGRLALRSGSALRPYSTHPLRPRPFSHWAAVAAFVAISGCSSFGGTEVQEPSQASTQKTATATATAGGATATASGASPDINSVPTSVPQPQDVSIDGVQSGLGADTGNAEYTETLTPPIQNVARPAAPAPAPAEPAAAQAAAAPATAIPAPAAPAVAGIPAPQAPAVAQAPLAAPVGQIQAPQLGVSGQLNQGYAGTPQPGSKPFGNAGGGYAPAAGTQIASNGVTVDYSSVGTAGTYGYASYGAYQRQNPAQALYRSPYAPAQPMAYQSVYGQQPAPAAVTPLGLAPAYGYGYQPVAYQPYGQPVAVPPLPPAGQPVGVVYFGNGSARLSSDDRKVVKQVADLQRYYGGVIRVLGHASMRTGNMDPYAQGQVNYEVSADRAQSIARAFTQVGVPAGLVQVAAAGAANPVSIESMPAGEANNRRVEIFLSAY